MEQQWNASGLPVDCQRTANGTPEKNAELQHQSTVERFEIPRMQRFLIELVAHCAYLSPPLSLDFAN